MVPFVSQLLSSTRNLRVRIRLFAIALLAAALSACDDPTRFQLDATVATDTFTLAAPSANRLELPSALDLTLLGDGIGGGRFPERAADAAQGFDLLLRVRDGQLVFLPPTVIGIKTEAGISQPRDNLTFASVTKLPDNVRFLTDEAVPVRGNAVYFVRTRRFPLGGGACQQFAKLAPLAVNVAAGTVELQATVSQNCSDTRFTTED